MQRSLKVKSVVTLYQKFNVTRSTIYGESFILASKSTHKKPLFWSYATLLCSFPIGTNSTQVLSKTEILIESTSVFVLTNFMSKKIFIDTMITLTASILTLLHLEIINLAIRRQKKKTLSALISLCEEWHIEAIKNKNDPYFRQIYCFTSRIPKFQL